LETDGVIAEPTRRLLGDALVVEDLGPLKLKGFADPLRVIAGEKAVESRFVARTMSSERGGNDRRLHPQILDMHVRKGIDQTDRAFGDVGVDTIVERRRQPSRKDRWVGSMR
jgi:hypothetical protein